MQSREIIGDSIPAVVSNAPERLKPLYQAVYHGNLKSLTDNALLAALAKPSNNDVMLSEEELSYSEKKPLLVVACQQGHLNVVKKLIKYGFDANGPKALKKRPFHVAVLKGRTDIASTLLEAGIDASIHAHGNQALIFWVYDRLSRSSKLSTKDFMDFFIALLKFHPDQANEKDRYNNTLLCRVVGSRYPMLVSILLAIEGIDINHRGDDGNTPLCFAIKQKNEFAVRHLLLAGASYNESNDSDEFPLHMAVQSGSAVIVEALLTAGASPNQMSYGIKSMSERCNELSGSFPLYKAVEMNYFDMALILLEAGADIKKKGYYMGPPLLIAASAKGHIGIVRFLTSEDRIAFLPDLTSLKKAREHALKKGFDEIVNCLDISIARITPAEPMTRELPAYASAPAVAAIAEQSDVVSHLLSESSGDPLLLCIDSLEVKARTSKLSRDETISSAIQGLRKDLESLRPGKTDREIVSEWLATPVLQKTYWGLGKDILTTIEGYFNSMQETKDMLEKIHEVVGLSQRQPALPIGKEDGARKRSFG